MDVLNYLQENNVYQNFNDFQDQKQEEFKQLMEGYKEQGFNLLIPGIDLLRRGKEVITKLTGEGEKVVGKVAGKAEGGIEEGISTIKGLASKALGIEDTTTQGLKTATQGVEEATQGIKSIGKSIFESGADWLNNTVHGVQSAVSNVENIGKSVAENVGETTSSLIKGFQGTAETASSAMKNLSSYEPSSELNQVSMNKFLSSAPKSEGGYELGNIGENVGKEVSQVGETVGETVGSTLASTAKAVGSAVGSAFEVLGPIGELASIGMSLYDLIKGETTHAPPVMVEAAPVLERGV
jgi:hypothetical protein